MRSLAPLKSTCDCAFEGETVTLPIVDENSIEALDLPGRHLRWLMTQEKCRCTPLFDVHDPGGAGRNRRPAHSHPNGEEIIYIVHGSGKVMIEGVVEPVKQGSAVLFPQGKVHMLRNTGRRR
jgi:mannose-6-phosphate isomerase-like protein (cupin superfamily)